MNARPASPLVALIGHPNTGKTTLFNRLTGARARVGNYPGITVERSQGQVDLPGKAGVQVVDIPGTYSLVARSPEEQIAIDGVLGRHGLARPDLVVVVVDATQLERNLYLVLQIIELGCPVMVALNMMDAAAKAGVSINPKALSEDLGVPVVPTIATGRGDLDPLKAAMAQALGDRPSADRWRWQPGPGLQHDLDSLLPVLGEEAPSALDDAGRQAVALWALMSLDTDDDLTSVPGNLRLRVLERQRAAEQEGRDVDGEVVTARYAWIDAHAPQWLRHEPPPTTPTERVDRVLLHPFLGLAIFLGLMLVVFESLFTWSEPLIGAVETLVGGLQGWVRGAVPPGVVADLLADGVVGGVGNVLVFVPQIALLFLFIGLMEDSGYMARAAFLMDRVMRKAGLHGRAFVPMLSAYACAVPAIMATRTLERRRDRFITMLALPLTTCSARLPVYTLIIAALIPATPIWGGVITAQGLVMMSMYIFGLVMTLLVAAVLSRTIFRGDQMPLILALPAYRAPSARSVGRLVWSRSSVFIKEAGTVILVCTLVLWALLYFPRTGPEVQALEAQRAEIAAGATDVATLPEADQAKVEALDSAIAGTQLAHSYGGRLGHAIEPVISPLGFDWKIGVGIIGAFAAREVFVGTLGVVFSLGEVDEESEPLRQQLREARTPDGARQYTPLMALSLLIFFALACQCMTTLAAVKRETMSYRWPLFLLAYMSVLAWLCSFAVYQGGQLLGFG